MAGGGGRDLPPGGECGDRGGACLNVDSVGRWQGVLSSLSARPDPAREMPFPARD